MAYFKFKVPLNIFGKCTELGLSDNLKSLWPAGLEHSCSCFLLLLAVERKREEGTKGDNISRNNMEPIMAW